MKVIFEIKLEVEIPEPYLSDIKQINNDNDKQKIMDVFTEMMQKDLEKSLATLPQSNIKVTNGYFKE